MQQQGGTSLKGQATMIQLLLREHFLREYYSPISFSALKPHLLFRQYLAGDVIFEQGDPVESYCFLLMGRVMVTRRHRQEQERSLLDGPTMLGECPEGQQLKRERTARVVSPEAELICIPKEAVNCLLAQQMAQLDYILEQLATFANISEGIDRMKLAPYVRLEKYRAKEVVKVREKVGYLVVRGECRVTSKRREAVVSHFNCLAISAYFQQPQECTYSAYSSQLVLVAFSYEAIPLLPASFLRNLALLHQAHKLAEESPLPRLQRNTANTSLHEKPAHLTHKAKKSSSVVQLDDGTAAELASFRKRFVLGFYPDQAVTSLDFTRKKLKQPKGYFQLKAKAESRVELQMRRRQWASYLQARSEQKAKSSKQKGNLKPRKQNTPAISPKHHTLADLINRYHNLPSLAKKQPHLVKATKSKQSLFRQ